MPCWSPVKIPAKLVGAAGIEPASTEVETARIDAKTPEPGSPNSPGGTVRNDRCGPEANPTNPIGDTDDAIFAAFKRAKAESDPRAAALLDLLSAKPAAENVPATVAPLVLVRGKGGRE